MEMRRIILITIAWCACHLPVLSQTGQYPFSYIDITRGLSHNQVNCILKDTRGFMWIGTMSGLNRFDGYNFKVFRHKIGDSTALSDDFIANILEGPEGKLWIETRSG